MVNQGIYIGRLKNYILYNPRIKSLDRRWPVYLPFLLMSLKVGTQNQSPATYVNIE